MLNINIESFSYPNSEKEVLAQVYFQLQKGEHLAILGESGCGKSTLLHIIYGLLTLEQGEIFHKNKQLFGPSHNLIPGHDCMKLVSQEFNLMPFTSVAENVGEHLTRQNRAEDSERIDEVLATVGLLDIKNQKVQLLSGGQKQRVALAKTLANAPKVLLLDEPFSSIDTFRKNHLRRDLFNYAKKHTITTITATHDAEEALAFADKLLVLKDGQMLTFGEPSQVYQSATSVYEKGFFGEVSVIEAGVFSDKEYILLPHELEISAEKTKLNATINNTYFKGSHFVVEAAFRGKTVYFQNPVKVTQPNVFLKLKS
jgi:iron(III) transport system ATP-binding protein